MISFNEIMDINGARRCIPDCPEELLDEVIAPLLADADGYSVAVSSACGCLLVRICEGGSYAFLFPFETADNADITEAICVLADYAAYQEISFTLLDIPAEMRERVDACGFSGVEYEVADEDGESFIADILTECSRLAEIPTVKGERLILDSLTEADIIPYAALCRDGELNKYWGYDYLADVGEREDGYFVAEAQRELSVGSALTLAVRDKEGLVGDVVIYGYDFRGGAKAGVRIAREYQRRGYGREASELMFSLAKEMGLCYVRAEIMKQNAGSLGLYSKIMERIEEREDCLVFEKRFK